MLHLRTKLATASPPPSPPDRVARALLAFLPRANPDYEGKFHLVREWLVEFDDAGQPFREIGLAADGVPIIAGPDERNYGFWLDTNMAFTDFTGEPISKELFESTWMKFHER